MSQYIYKANSRQKNLVYRMMNHAIGKQPCHSSVYDPKIYNASLVFQPISNRNVSGQLLTGRQLLATLTKRRCYVMHSI